jgi:hypothetical protein
MKPLKKKVFVVGHYKTMVVFRLQVLVVVLVVVF